MRGSLGGVGGVACAVLVCACLAVPAPALASRHRQPDLAPQVDVSVRGLLTIAWTGEAADGCATAGVCGVSGSLEVAPVAGDQGSSPAGQPPVELEDPSAVARVQTTAADGVTSSCADIVSTDFFLTVRDLGTSLSAAIDAEDSLVPPSAGRCAGPTASDLSGLSVPVRELGRRGYDMSGQTSFTAGPFQVTVVSTMRARFTPDHSDTSGVSSGGPSFHLPKAHHILQESAGVSYRVSAITGSLFTAFTGRTPPLCDGLGSCGSRGQLLQTFTTRGTVIFAGTRLVHRRVSRSQALADLHAGRLELFDTFGALSVKETLAESASLGGGGQCTSTASLPVFSGSFGPRRPDRDQLVLASDSGLFATDVMDPFRTDCPGPSDGEITGNGPIATAQVTAGELGAPRLSLTFRTRRVFSGLGYAGRRGGTVVISLTRA